MKTKEKTRDSGLLWMLYATLVFSTVAYGAVDVWALIPLALFSSAIVVIWTLYSLRARSFDVSTSSLQFPLIGLISIGLIQLLPFRSASGSEILNIPAANDISLDPYATRLFVIRLAIYLIFFAAALRVFDSNGRVRRTAFAIAVFGAGMAVFGILQRLANVDGIYGLRQTNQAITFGPFVNQHHFAAFMAMTASVSLALSLSADIRRTLRYLLMAAFGIMTLAVIFTSSRGGLLSLACASVFILLVRARNGADGNADAHALKKPYYLWIAGVAAAALLIAGIAIYLGAGSSLSRGLGMTAVSADATNGRFHFWAVAWRIFADHPLFGAGYDAFGVAFTRYDSWNGSLRVEQAHNDYLQALADGGVAAFFCVAAFIYLFVRRAWAAIRISSGPQRNVRMGAMAGCIAIFIHSVFDFPLRTPSNAFFFLLLAALATYSTETIDRSATVSGSSQ